MTITQLKYVLAVAEYQNFTKAAKNVFVTQPTLSMQIQKLEDELDIQIFDRTKKPIQLTEVGKKLVVQARNIVNESNRMQDVVDQQKGFIGGEFTLGIIPTIMPTLLPMFLNTYIKKFPKVKLKIVELPTESIIQDILDGHLDAAIAATPLNNINIKERVLYYEPFVGYVPPNNKLANHEKLSPADLDINEMLLLEDGHCFRDSVLNICKTQKTYDEERFKLASGSFETMIKLANEGLGMTLLPYLNSLDIKETDKQNLRSFEDPSPAREVSLIYHKSELKIQIINSLKDTITSIIKGAIAFQNVQIISPLGK
ncbi:hydrogen peroxide-inducible genes activator [Aquimarina agarilytica]|uniref:hydrogen peroxide-inducible genes activator n=1 Tax=Aquimarina agarilytica TaxID=1087449 RepID=UPI000287E215|nr:hydrogen peroxide-inducible genes activator [Aquimarina agarilytica]